MTYGEHGACVSIIERLEDDLKKLKQAIAISKQALDVAKEALVSTDSEVHDRALDEIERIEKQWEKAK